MSTPIPTVPSGSWVLITGANGHLASEIASQFLSRGYRVRGTVRSVPSSSWLLDVFSSYVTTGHFELITVPDISIPTAFVSAVSDVSIILHVATLGFSSDPNKIIPPEVAAARSLLTAASREPSVKQFVLTSSVVAATGYHPTSTELITSNTWNEKAVKEAWAPPPYTDARAFAVYSASKVASEREVWRFREEEKPQFGINAVLPQTILGRRLNKECKSVSAALLPDLMEGRTEVHDSIVPAIFAVDVRDVALLHVAAALDPEVDGQRLHAWGRPMTWNGALRVLRGLFPKRKLIDDRKNNPSWNIRADVTKELALLKKWGGQDDWRPIEETFLDNLDHIPRD
ncbi:hypothetical protein OQA88_8756 [Cercophora sp. LCS_1]